MESKMSIKKPGMHHLLAPVFALSLTVAAPAVFAQQGNQTTSTSSTQASSSASSSARTVASGQKMKIKGVVTKRDADTFTVRDDSGVDTTVLLTNTTSVKSSGGFLRSGNNYAQTNILGGLNVEVEGHGDGSGQLIADKVRFKENDLKVARSIDTRVNPVENRVGTNEQKIAAVEANAQKLSGQIDELAAVSNAARGGAKAAQETADAAVAGVNATNERISALDDYTPADQTTVNFRTNSAVLSPEAKGQLDQIAQKAMNAKGYVIEVSGFTDSTGRPNYNQQLSQRRADAVIRYMVETHHIPLRRIVTPFGYGETNAIADNQTRQGRAENRRVEVKVLTSKGLNESAPTINTPSSSGATSSNTSPE
jgi:outer membrane protein OmpA-like peptidoglycan-associated protein